jgi:hypothetical protein
MQTLPADTSTNYVSIVAKAIREFGQLKRPNENAAPQTLP